VPYNDLKRRTALPVVPRGDLLAGDDFRFQFFPKECHMTQRLRGISDEEATGMAREI